jgi:phosphoribosylformimino-5-aminoimidazole carboxamide ribotide isomerase
LHGGQVKQIVGSTLRDDAAGLRTNFVSERPASWFAEMYRQDGLTGGHVIMLGPGNESQARLALQAFPQGMQVGGGINLDNATSWLEAGASHVIVTSWIFREGRVVWERLEQLSAKVGKENLVLDLSCRRRGTDYVVMTERFQRYTDCVLSGEMMARFAPHCAEFLIHAVDVEGLCAGIETELVSRLSEWQILPTTYAGGARSMEDVHEVYRLGKGRIDLAIGSALDIFGGQGIRYRELVALDKSFKEKKGAV